MWFYYSTSCTNHLLDNKINYQTQTTNLFILIYIVYGRQEKLLSAWGGSIKLQVDVGCLGPAIHIKPITKKFGRRASSTGQNLPK